MPDGTNAIQHHPTPRVQTCAICMVGPQDTSGRSTTALLRWIGPVLLLSRVFGRSKKPGMSTEAVMEVTGVPTAAAPSMELARFMALAASGGVDGGCSSNKAASVNSLSASPILFFCRQLRYQVPAAGIGPALRNLAQNHVGYENAI